MRTETQISWLRWVVRACICTAIVLIGVYLIVWRWLGSTEAAWALLRGEEIVVIPATVDVGDCLAGDVEEVELRVVNMSFSRVTLTGMYSPCSCVLASSLPAMLEPRGTSILRMTIHASGEQGDFARRAVLYTDSTVSPQLPILVVGKILETERRAELVPAPQRAEGQTTSDG